MKSPPMIIKIELATVAGPPSEEAKKDTFFTLYFSVFQSFQLNLLQKQAKEITGYAFKLIQYEILDTCNDFHKQYTWVAKHNLQNFPPGAALPCNK